MENKYIMKKPGGGMKKIKGGDREQYQTIIKYTVLQGCKTEDSLEMLIGI